MKLVLRVPSRFEKVAELYDVGDHLIDRRSDVVDFFLLVVDLLDANRLKPNQLTSVSVAASEGVLWTGVKAAYALANALNFALNLKRIDELSFPERPAAFYADGHEKAGN